MVILVGGYDLQQAISELLEPEQLLTLIVIIAEKDVGLCDERHVWVGL